MVDIRRIKSNDSPIICRIGQISGWKVSTFRIQRDFDAVLIPGAVKNEFETIVVVDINGDKEHIE